MYCESIELTMETTQPRDVAKAMLRFWQFQFEQARQKVSASEAKANHMRLANKQAEEDWRKDGDASFFGPSVPYPTLEIERVDRSLPKLHRQYQEAKAMYGYMINFITDKAHPEVNAS